MFDEIDAAYYRRLARDELRRANDALCLSVAEAHKDRARIFMARAEALSERKERVRDSGADAMSPRMEA